MYLRMLQCLLFAKIKRKPHVENTHVLTDHADGVINGNGEIYVAFSVVDLFLLRLGLTLFCLD